MEGQLIITELCPCGESVTRSAIHCSPPVDKSGNLKASKQHIYFDPMPLRLEIDKQIQVAQAELNRFNDRIERHQSLLETLKEERREIEAYIEDKKSALAPVRLLPGDVLGEIFTHLCGTGDNRFSKSRLETPALNVSRVCSLWRAVAKENPHIWSDITIELDRRRSESLRGHRTFKGIPPTLSHYLTLSGNSPLSIHLIYPYLPPGHGSFGAEKFGDHECEILATISPHSHRIDSLTAPVQAFKWWANPVLPHPDRPPTYSVDNTVTDSRLCPSFFIPLKLRRMSVPFTNELLTAETAKLFDVSSNLTEIQCSMKLLSGILSSTAPRPTVIKLITTHVETSNLRHLSQLCPYLKHFEVRVEYGRRPSEPEAPLPVILPFVQTLVVDFTVVSEERLANWTQALRLPSLLRIEVFVSSSPHLQSNQFTSDIVKNHPISLVELIHQSNINMSPEDIRYDGLSLEELQRARHLAERQQMIRPLFTSMSDVYR